MRKKVVEKGCFCVTDVEVTAALQLVPYYCHAVIHLRRLRRESGNDASSVANVLQSNIVVRTLILRFLPILGLFALWPFWYYCLLWIRLLDVPEPAAKVGHKILLDIGMGDSVAAYCLPYRSVGIGKPVAHNVGTEGEVGVELGERRLDLLQVEGLESLRAVLPLFDLRIHGLCLQSTNTKGFRAMSRISRFGGVCGTVSIVQNLILSRAWRHVVQFHPSTRLND
jgi:hypothetical protein